VKERKRERERDCLSGEFATEGGEEDRKQTAFPGNSSLNERKQMIIKRLLFRGIRLRRR
jgi:hypothetical protein